MLPGCYCVCGVASGEDIDSLDLDFVQTKKRGGIRFYMPANWFCAQLSCIFLFVIIVDEKMATMNGHIQDGNVDNELDRLVNALVTLYESYGRFQDRQERVEEQQVQLHRRILQRLERIEEEQGLLSRNQEQLSALLIL